MRQILLAASFLLLTISLNLQTASAQQPCTLKLSQSPSMRGVKLGMTVDQLLSLFPGSSDNAEIKQRLSASEGYPDFGDVSFYLAPSRYATGDHFAGVAEFYISSFDGRVVGVRVQYLNFPTGARWRRVDDLVEKFADSFHLPGPKDWEANGADTRQLKCDGFETAVWAAGDSSSISLFDRSWVQTKQARSAAFEEQKRREFKP